MVVKAKQREEDEGVPYEITYDGSLITTDLRRQIEIIMSPIGRASEKDLGPDLEASVAALNISESTALAQDQLEKEFSKIIKTKTLQKGVNPLKIKKILSEVGLSLGKTIDASIERSELVAVLDTIDRLESQLLALPPAHELRESIARFEIYIADVGGIFRGGNIPPKEAAWIRICRKILAVHKAELELTNLAEKRFKFVEARYKAAEGLTDLYDKYKERWEAQSGGDFQRRRNLSHDMSLRYIIERSEPPLIDTTVMFDHACDILSEIRQKCVVLRSLSPNMKDSEEKASIRKAMFAFYSDIEKAFMPIQAQSGGCDEMIRKMKITERIRESEVPHGLGKSRKSGHAVPKCFNRHSGSRAAIPPPSYRSAARDKFADERENKFNSRNDFTAQSWTDGLMPDIKLDAGTTRRMDEVIDQMRILNEKGLRVELDLLSNFKQHFADLFASMGSAVSPLLVGLGVAFCAFKAYTTRNPVWVGLTTMSAIGASMWGLSKELLHYIERFRKIAVLPEGEILFEAEDVGNDEFQAQSNSKECFMTVVLGYVYSSLFSGLKSDNMVCEYLKKTSDVPKWKQGMSSQIDFIVSLVQKFLDFMHVRFGTPEYQLMEHPYPDAYTFALQAEKLENEFNNGLDYNYENGQRYYNLIAKGNTVMAKIPSNINEGRDARQMIRLAIASMRPIGAKLARANVVNNGPRIAPLGVMIGGPSGVGKTDIAQFLMNRVTAAVIPDEMRDAFEKNHNDTTFTRNAENGFWDGYHGQFNVYDDDIGQTKDVAGQPANGFMEMVRMLGPGNYPLDMAHLEDKGNVNFRSSVVYCTTNRKKFILDSMYSNEPFCRRFKIAYVMVPAIGYCKPDPMRSGDVWNRRVSHFPPDRSDTSHLEFYKWNPETGEVSSTPITYDDLVDKIIAAYRDTHAKGSEMMRLHQIDKVAALKKRDKEREAITAQAGGASSEESIYQDAVSTQSLKVPDAEVPAVKVFKPTLAKLAREAGVSYDFAEEHASKLRGEHKGESWAMQVARLAIHSETLQNTSASQQSLTASICKKYVDGCKPYVDKAAKLIGEHRTIITTALAALGLLKVGLTMLNGSVPKEAQSVGGMRHPKNREFSAPKAFSKRGERFKAFDLKPRKSGHGHMQLRGKGIVSQAGGDGNAVDILRKVVRKCQYTIRLPESNFPMGKITFIKPWLGIAPLHFGERLQYGIDEGVYDQDSHIDIWSVVTPDQKISIAIPDLGIKCSEIGSNNDWCLISIPHVIERTPNILKYWAEETDLIDRGQFSIILNMVREHEVYLHQSTALVRKGVCYEMYEIAHGYAYDIETISGDCGGLLTQCNKSASSGKLIGIHTAGHGSKGFGPRILRHEIEEAMRAFDDDMSDDCVVSDEMDDIFDLELPGDTIPGFKAQCHGRFVSAPGSTAIRRSPLHGTYSPSGMAPAILRPRVVDDVLQDPMAITRKKYAKNVVAINPMLLKLVSDYVFARMCKNSVNNAPWAKPCVFTFEEACQGVPGVPFIEGIPRDTSPGYPFRLDTPRGFKGKTHFFGVEPEYEFNSKSCIELRERVDDIIDKASKGVRCVHVYMDFLKDERRSKEKVKACKTRMVSACPIDLLIAHRMYFMDFVRWMMENRVTNGSAVGVNCYSSEWDLLAKELESVSGIDRSSIIAGDFSGYDGSITTQIQLQVLRIICLWYGDGHDLIRTVLWEDICASRHISGDIIYEWTGCNPSGCFPTTALNTLTNMFMIVYSFVVAYLKKYDMMSEIGSDEFSIAVQSGLGEATKYLRYVCYGDDNLIAVSSFVEDYFDQEVMTDILGSVGYTYTSEAKTDEEVAPLRPLGDVTFLKRSFARSDKSGKRLCPLEISVILEMPQWTKKNDHNFEDVRVNVETALKELSLHDREVFAFWSKRIIKESLDRLGYVPNVTDYDALQAITLASPELL